MVRTNQLTIASKSHYRWYVCLFVFFTTVLNYMDRETLGIVAPLIQSDFHINNRQLGLLFSVFYIAYGLSVACVGEVIDRVSIRLSLAVIVAWWSVVTVLTGFSRGFGQLFGLRALLGIGEAGNWPATARLVSMYLPPEERTLANSIYMGGGSLGLVIIQPLLVWLSMLYGWRGGFVIIGLLSSFWIVAWLWWFRPSRVEGMKRHDLTTDPRVSSWSEIIREPRFWGLIAASFFGNSCLYFLMNWLPTFLVQDRHFKFGMKLGGIVALPFVGLDLGYLFSGFVVLKLAKSKWPTLFVRRFVLIAAATLMGVSMMSIPYAKTDALVVALLIAATFGMAAWNSNYLCFVEELSPSKVSAVAGVVGSAGAFGGALFLWLIGLISEISGSFTPVFLLVGVMIWLASAGLLFTAEPQKLRPFSIEPLQTKT